MKKMFLFAVMLTIAIGLTGCSEKNRAYKNWTTDPYVEDTFNEAINEIADQLAKKSRITNGEKIAITSFVDLHQLNKSTRFGRKMSESMFDELHTRGFNVVDARGTQTIRINAGGEFFITRDIKLLKGKRIENSYILVGTYSKFGNGILLNVRIIDNISGDVISTARTIIDVNACDIYENCDNCEDYSCKKKVVETPKVIIRTIGISDAGCSYVTCPTNCVDDGCDKYKITPQQAPKHPKYPKICK